MWMLEHDAWDGPAFNPGRIPASHPTFPGYQDPVLDKAATEDECMDDSSVIL